MSRNPDVPCASCGRLIWRGATSLPPGEATCQPCRRKANPRKPATLTELRFCKICAAPFETNRPTQVYCSADCRNSRRRWAESRPTSTERGYGVTHQRERKKWKPIVEAGNASCCLCGYPIDPGTRWHLDHTPDRSGYRGVAHADCNIRDGARRARRRQLGTGAGSKL